MKDSFLHRIVTWIHNIRYGIHQAEKCGHYTKTMGRIERCDRSRIVIAPLNDDGKPIYCISCIESMTIKCVECGQPIFIHDNFTLIRWKGGEKLRKGARRFPADPLYAYACTDPECTYNPDPSHRGVWVIPGEPRMYEEWVILPEREAIRSTVPTTS